jgi:Zn-dependent protease
LSLDPEHVLEFVVTFAVFIFSVIVHENAHGLVAERFGDPTARMLGRITMNPVPHIDPVGSIIMPLLMFWSGIPLIGWAKPVPVDSSNLRNPHVHNAYVAAAGPASNFILAILGTLLYIVVLLFYKHMPSLQAGGGNTLLFFRTLCLSMIQLNCVLGVLNLIPVPPLDGHWILFRYLPSRYGAILAAMRPYGFFILILLLWTGGLRLILGFPLHFLVGNLLGFVRAAVGAL